MVKQLLIKMFVQARLIGRVYFQTGSVALMLRVQGIVGSLYQYVRHSSIV